MTGRSQHIVTNVTRCFHLKCYTVDLPLAALERLGCGTKTFEPTIQVPWTAPRPRGCFTFLPHLKILHLKILHGVQEYWAGLLSLQGIDIWTRSLDLVSQNDSFQLQMGILDVMSDLISLLSSADIIWTICYVCFLSRKMPSECRNGAQHNGWARKWFKTLQCWQIIEETNQPTTMKTERT